MSRLSFFNDIFASVFTRAEAGGEVLDGGSLAELSDELLSGRGEMSGLRLARTLLARFEEADEAERLAFFELLAERFDVDAGHVERAARRYGEAPNAANLSILMDGGRAAAAGALPAAEPGARRDRPAGAHARVPAGAGGNAPGTRAARSRLQAPLPLVVQPGIPGASGDRLEHPGQRAREDHRLRGGARHRQLGGAARAARTARPALLRLLPSGDARRAADLRRGGADPGACPIPCGP